MKASLFVFVLLCVQAYGQVKLTGVILNADREALPGVNVFLVDTYDGTSTDDQGRFEFLTTEKGVRTLHATFVGFKPYRQNVTIADQDFQLEIILEEEINELQAVTITAGGFTASDESRRTIFRALDIATTAGATADIAGALNTLPGTQKVGESGRLFVRGGDGNETRTFIDGLVVLDAYGPAAPNTPSRGRFLPFMFKGMSFSTGGYSSEYGQALSSALVLDSKDKSERTRTDFGILSVGGDVGHTQSWDRGSLAGKIQYTNLRPYVGMIRQEIDWKNAPVSLEGSSAFRHTVGKSGVLKFYGNFNHSNFSLYNHDIDDNAEKELFDLTNNYRYLNGFYKNALNTAWSVRGGFSYTYLQNKRQTETETFDEVEKGLHLKTVLEGSLSDHVELKTGAEIIARSFNQSVDPKTPQAIVAGFEEYITSIFAEADVFASNRFVVRTGARMEHNNLLQKLSVDPRLSMAYKIVSGGQISIAYGKFRQSPRNEHLMQDHTLNPERATHYILNYQHIKNNKTFRIETYYKKYTQLIKFLDGDPTNLSNLGGGDAKGIELFWRDNGSVNNLDYWITYSYLDTKRYYLDFPSRATPGFASKHNASIVAKYFVQKIKSQLGFTYSFTSGRPYNDPNVSGFNSLRTPNYADLSFNWSYLPFPTVIVYFSCTNVLGRDNIFGYEYSTVPSEDGHFNGRAIRQPAPRFLFLGIFITLSKDKSVNQLPEL
ncbi:carboxypeptidase-like regulatory domain-containing protein [Chryseolinea sp. H1M3-3]|uniref:TonB-dependent receptor n=1 Tax=Chryseolinea sp. H1M3-3 TaxID=3034144 RepID=UPI0023EAD08C|nr:carboxypeptidase-like regulatory domain-containing protein [Chryseolinea sp. H1M3-3]